MVFFSAPHSNERGCRVQIPWGQQINLCCCWGRASPNHPAISWFFFLRSFVQRCGSALRALSHLKTSDEGNGQVAGQRNTPISAWEKIQQTQHTQVWHWAPWPGRSLHPLLQGSTWPACKCPFNTLVICRSCSAPFASFPGIAGLVFAYRTLLSSEIK